ncbi:hypothetical protein COCVIDRAFT_14612 [Bipolaris victoriae FI3]|uniref:Uncharacterized protein n=1 Tax=Bipolaris victoriae (strain FI3) TaxID=930091 RepID=W7EL51_BIPV3|nr:hypothetical protein COCVIDRAFT_14612 [Bipolaris victoriae FI3]
MAALSPPQRGAPAYQDVRQVKEQASRKRREETSEKNKRGVEGRETKRRKEDERYRRVIPQVVTSRNRVLPPTIDKIAGPRSTIRAVNRGRIRRPLNRLVSRSERESQTIQRHGHA